MPNVTVLFPVNRYGDGSELTRRLQRKLESDGAKCGNNVAVELQQWSLTLLVEATAKGREGNLYFQIKASQQLPIIIVGLPSSGRLGGAMTTIRVIVMQNRMGVATSNCATFVSSHRCHNNAASRCCRSGPTTCGGET